MTMTATILDRLSTEYPLQPEVIASFRENGHVMLPELCNLAEVDEVRSVLNGAVARLNTEVRPLEERDTYGKAFLQIMNLWVNDKAVQKFVLAKRFAKVAAELMGVEAVRLYHDQALYKEGGGGHTPWHQDQYYWPLDTVNTVTMWMPLVDVPIEMGALTFASGSHKSGFMGSIEISDRSQSEYDMLVKEKGYPVRNQVMKAGDATFHSGWTLHCAPGNAGTTTREVMTIIYYADGVNILPVLDNKNRENDLDSWFPGVKIGEPALSRLNPLLYSR